jgi:hypothetical protein
MSDVTGRDAYLISKALAIAIEVISRAHIRHQPQSDADDMAELYLSLAPDELARRCDQRSVAWILAGGIDLRERELEPLPIAPPPPDPKERERIAA